MWLPAAGLQQFPGAGSAGPPQQFEDLRRLAPAPGIRLGDFGVCARRGRVFRGVGLLTWLGLRCRDVRRRGGFVLGFPEETVCFCGNWPSPADECDGGVCSVQRIGGNWNCYCIA